MEVDKLMAGLERFFFDVVGSLIPGVMLITGVWLTLSWGQGYIQFPAAASNPAFWWLFVAFSYAIGNGLTTVGERLISPAFCWMRQKFWREPDEKSIVISARESDTRISNCESFGLFSSRILPGMEVSSNHVGQLRNVAMTVISAEHRATVIRFTFLSLLSLGAATAILLTLPVAAVVAWNRGHDFLSSGLFTLLALITFFGASVPFLVRRFEFFERARRLPFDMVITPTEERKSNKMRQYQQMIHLNRGSGPRSVYLAGGHRTDWRSRVIREVPSFEYRDPSLHKLDQPEAYTAWDLEAVEYSDVLFAYLEEENPSGYGLALEVGYSSALGKHVIFVDEKSKAEPAIAPYLAIIRETADVQFEALQEGITYLKSLSLIKSAKDL